MSDSQHPPDLDELIEGNPDVDADQLREAQEQLEELVKGGLPRPGYEIEAPHERRPLRREPGTRRIRE